jgi:monoamine oxidase
MARQVTTGAPWESPKAAEWDSMTLATWFDQNVHSDRARAIADFTIELIRSCNPRDVSLLSFLSYVRGMANEGDPNGGSLERLINVTGGAQQSRVVGGTQLISIRMAQQLGRRVVLGSPVRRIVNGNPRARVETDARTYLAKRVVVAMSPAMSAQLFVDPPLPFTRAQLVQRYPQASVIKAQCFYPRPFWRDEGLTGIAVGTSDPLHVTLDNSPPDGKPGVLVGFIAGSRARAFGQRTKADRRRAVVQCFVDYFGPQAADPYRYLEADWMSARWTRGCYAGFSAPGVLLDYGPALRAPTGRIHWGGSETSDYSWGGMDGAARAGDRTAAEVLARL